MVLIVPVEGAREARRHVRGNGAIDANRTAENELPRSMLICRTKQVFRPSNIDFLKIRRCCLSPAPNRRQMYHLLDLVFFENPLDDCWFIKIARNYDSAFANQRLRLGVALTVSEDAHELRIMKGTQFPGDVPADKAAGSRQQN